MLGHTTRCLLSPETANNLLVITQPVVVRQVEQGRGVQNGGGYKTRKGKACENGTKGLRTGVTTSGKTNTTPGCPVYTGQAQGERNI